jgi:3-oxoacyl-(acyl-carrier-protein) synthase
MLRSSCGGGNESSAFQSSDFKFCIQQMSAEPGIFVCGIGAVSPAGWGVACLCEALSRGEPIPASELIHPVSKQSFRVRQPPIASPRPSFMAHPRLRRTSPIAHYTAGVALEALGDDAAGCGSGAFRLGIILCVMTGCVNYSRRFYDEVLSDPATASPLIFPETVCNSPASHLAALLGSTAINYTLVGDPGAFLQGIVLAADWLADGRVDGCLVIGAEEMDWLTGDAMRLFERRTIVSAGAGALYLRRRTNQNPAIQLRTITSGHLFCGKTTRAQAAQLARAELAGASQGQLLCDGLQGVPRADRDEETAWRDWSGARLSPKTILGEGFMAAAAWQCVAAVAALKQDKYDAAIASVVGVNQQAIAAQFARVKG